MTSLCGNGNIDAGEQCDGANLNGQDCISLGYTGGTLSCSLGCTFNITSCTGGGPPPPPPICGDSVCNASSECVSGCASDCTVSDCCGNGTCDSAIGENSANCGILTGGDC